VTVVSGPFPRPEVTITNPAGGAVFMAPASFAVSAAASAGIGALGSVQFFRGTTAFGTDTSAPYSVNLNNIPAGSYVFTAVARDSFGHASTSAPVTVTVAAPAVITNVNIQDFAFSPRTIRVAAGSTVIWQNLDTDGHTVAGAEASTEALCGPGVMLDAITSCTNRFMTPGTYPYFCTIHPEMRGTVVVTRAISTPMVNLRSPSTGSTFLSGSLIILEADATDADGIANVQFFNGIALLGASSSNPYQLTLTNLAAGNYSILAKATDMLGFSDLSPQVEIAVIAPTLIQLFAPGLQDNGLFQFNYTADPGLTYVIEGSVNSGSILPFMPLQTNTANTNIVTFFDSEPRGSRAYRVRLLP
jgi:plastocyanin